MVRLRSLASQHLNIAASVRDGYMYPFLIFSVTEKGENQQMRMIELNFVENVLIDKYKDHIQRSYHFAMINKVMKGFQYDEFFIEFNNDKPLSYYSTFPL